MNDAMQAQGGCSQHRDRKTKKQKLCFSKKHAYSNIALHFIRTKTSMQELSHQPKKNYDATIIES